MITTLDEKVVVARKASGCPLCGMQIEVGERHYTQRCADGSSTWTYRAHSICHAEYDAYLRWAGWEPRDLDEGDYGTADHAEFRAFLRSQLDAARTTHNASGSRDD